MPLTAGAVLPIGWCLGANPLAYKGPLLELLELRGLRHIRAIYQHGYHRL